VGGGSKKKLDSRWKNKEGHPHTTEDTVDAKRKMDTVFAEMKKVLSGLDLLTKKVVDMRDMDAVNLRQERGEGIPAKTGEHFMEITKKPFRKSLLTRVKRDFSPLEYTAITAQMDDLDALHHQYNTEVKENRERTSDHDGVLLRRYS
jgi:hypothetical protein